MAEREIPGSHSSSDPDNRNLARFFGGYLGREQRDLTCPPILNTTVAEVARETGLAEESVRHLMGLANPNRRDNFEKSGTEQPLPVLDEKAVNDLVLQGFTREEAFKLLNLKIIN